MLKPILIYISHLEHSNRRHAPSITLHILFICLYAFPRSLLVMRATTEKLCYTKLNNIIDRQLYRCYGICCYSDLLPVDSLWFSLVALSRCT